MTQKELDYLFNLKRKKRIKNKEIAKALGCSESLISQFFNGKCDISPEKEMAIKRYISDTNNDKEIHIVIKFNE